jgi:carbonic anhydrase/acetyltransferase-like protein (isoleucine patch superfamily)
MPKGLPNLATGTRAGLTWPPAGPPEQVRAAREEAQMPLYAIADRAPTIHPTAFVHPDAILIGDVTIGAESSVWPAAVLRGDHGAIRVGAQTSIQDGSVLHCTDTLDTVIGDRCVVGHCAHLEGCIVADDCLIGSGAVVLQNAAIQAGAMVAAQALVTMGMTVPSGAVAMGVPARIKEGAVRHEVIAASVATYVHNAHWYNAQMRRVG